MQRTNCALILAQIYDILIWFDVINHKPINFDKIHLSIYVELSLCKRTLEHFYPYWKVNVQNKNRLQVFPFDVGIQHDFNVNCSVYSLSVEICEKKLKIIFKKYVCSIHDEIDEMHFLYGKEYSSAMESIWEFKCERSQNEVLRHGDFF